MPVRGRRDFLSAPTRRAVLGGLAAGACGGAALRGAVPVFAIGRDRPQVPGGVVSGDPLADGAVIWSRCERPARLEVEVALEPGFRDAHRVVGPDALAADDFTARVTLRDLPADQRVFYRACFVDLADRKAVSEPLRGSFRTAPYGRAVRPLRLCWSGDTVGQGWGIDRARGGMRGYRAMLQRRPDAFLHVGDMIYADNPIEPEVVLPDGSLWKNVVTPDVAKVAETLDEFRGRYRYNQLDDNLRAFHAEVPLIGLWDDHEVTNNWYPGEFLDDPRYQNVRSVDLLAARARRAFLDHVPLRSCADDPRRLYRKLAMGPQCDVFVIEMRGNRGRNTRGDQSSEGPDTAILGAAQVRWLLRELAASTATWKIISCDMPLGLVIRDGAAIEAVADGTAGAPRGRELEIARVLRGIHAVGVQNVVWLTADVHYTAAHHYHPERGSIGPFTPFWEFVSGPLHAGTFGPNPLDATFGAEVVYAKAPRAGQANLSPAAGLQFFGELEFAPDDGVGGGQELTVALRDIEGHALWQRTLEPVRG